MNVVVVDSSVVAKWVLPETDDEIADRLLATAGTINQLSVLDLAFVEVANAIWSRYRRKLIDERNVEAAFRLLFRTPVQVEPAVQLLESALQNWHQIRSFNL